jgi:DNA-binding transcriptional ArsR family regulator
MIGEPARAAMLSALMGGQPMPAGELARCAGVAPATASAHLAQMVESGLLVRRQAGRHRLYTLASLDVATALETLALISPNTPRATPSDAAFRFARTCYDHLAGTLGVLLTDTLVERDILRGAAGFELTARGDVWLSDLGIDVAALRAQRRSFVRPCLDWSERRHHVAGSVGAALATVMLERRWLARIAGTRALRLTMRGREGLYRALALEVS